MFILILILIINSIYSINKMIELYFNTFNPKDINTENFIEKYFYNKIYTEIFIGTPQQKIILSIKLQHYPFYIIDKSIININNSLNYFNKNLSSTFIQSKSSFSGLAKTDISYSYISEDNFKFGNIFLENFKFNLVTKLNYENDLIFGGGSIGLDLYCLNEIFKESHFITQLKSRSFIQSYDFSIKYLNDNKGKIIIGLRPDEYDKNYNEKNLNYMNIAYIYYIDYWSCTFYNITSNGYNLLHSYATNFFKIEFGFIKGSSEYYKLILENFFDNLIKEKKCEIKNFDIKEYSTKHYEYIICEKNINLNKFGNLTLYNKELNYSFIFDEKDLFKKFNDKIFFLIIFESLSSNEWIFGKPFFKKYHLLFNQDKKIIGVYTDFNHNNKKFSFFSIISFKLLIIIFLFILVCLFVYIIIFYLKYPRKLRSNELKENFDYISYQVQKNEIELKKN